jgi:predicted ferric reductase
MAKRLDVSALGSDNARIKKVLTREAESLGYRKAGPPDNVEAKCIHAREEATMSVAPMAAGLSTVRPPRRPVGPGAVEAVGWIGLYVALAALPLAAALIRPVPPARGVWIEFAVGLGFVALAMLGLQFALTARFRRIAAPYGLDTLLHFHRQAGLVAFGLALVHPLILFIAEPAFLAFLDPRAGLIRAGALWALLGCLVLVIGLTLWRQPIGMSYDWWRVTHGVLAFLVVFIGLVHVLRVGYYISVPWKQGMWVAVTGGAMLLLVHARLIKPLRLRRSPYRVTEVRPERGQSWTLALEPVGHGGMHFEAGQFAWLTLGSSPFALEQHPFSFASSAQRPRRLELTIKELGDFTSRIDRVAPGTTAFLEGPYGAFTLDPDAGGAVFIVGGVGVTPVMSILRTMLDTGDSRPAILIYGSPNWNEVIFREELAELEEELRLRVVHVLEHATVDWEGETGRIDEDLLCRHLPRDMPALEYFVCGPESMMDVVEPFLLERGVSLRRLNSERFNIA